MHQFYYSILPRDGLIFGVVAYINNEPAGFVTATHDSTGFMSSALRRHRSSLIWVIGTSVLSELTRLGAIWEAWQIMRSLPPAEAGQPVGEILSLAVCAAYREPRFIRETGLRISADLLGSAVAQIQARGGKKIRAIVDADNLAAKLFYSGLGWTLDRPSVPGWRVPTVEFVLRS